MKNKKLGVRMWLSGRELEGPGFNPQDHWGKKIKTERKYRKKEEMYFFLFLFYYLLVYG